MIDLKGLFKKYFTDTPETGTVQLFRSLVIGAVATLVDMGVLILFEELTSVSTWISSTAAYLIGMIVNFLLTSLWGFRGQQSTGRAAEFIGFCIISVIGLLMNDGIIMLFKNVLGPARIFGSLLPTDKYYIVGKIVATVVVFIWNFVMRKITLYRGNRKA